MIFHRHFLVSKRLNVVCKFLRSGYLEIMGAKTTRLRVAETRRLQLNEIRTVVRVSALPRHFKENGSSMNGALLCASRKWATGATKAPDNPTPRIGQIKDSRR